MTRRPVCAYAAIMRTLRPRLRDVATALAATIVLVAASYAEAHPAQNYLSPGQHLKPTPIAAFLLVILAGLVLIWRYCYPRTVLCVSTAAVAAYSLLGFVNGAALLLPAVAMWALATSVPDPPFGRLGGGRHRGADGRHGAEQPVRMERGRLRPRTGQHRGRVVRRYRDRRPPRLRGERSASAAEREARRPVDEERLRIARELHDVVAHTMATINVQASAAAQVLRDRPEQAAESLSRHPRGEQGRAARTARHPQRAHGTPTSPPTPPVPRPGWRGWTRSRKGSGRRACRSR